MKQVMRDFVSDGSMTTRIIDMFANSGDWRPNAWSISGSLQSSDFCYHSTANKWFDYVDTHVSQTHNKMYEGSNRCFHGDDILVSGDVVFNDTHIKKGNSVLIVGSGPTADKLDQTYADAYDEIWTVNHFRSHSFLCSSDKLSLVSLGNESDFSLKMFDFLVDKDITLMQEPHYIKKNINLFLNGKLRYGWFTSRWSGRLGVVPRLVSYAIASKYTKIGTIGFDGYLSDWKTPRNTFRKNLTFNSMDRFHGYNTFEIESIMFLDYLHYLWYKSGKSFAYFNEGEKYKGDNLFGHLKDKFSDTESWKSYGMAKLA